MLCCCMIFFFFSSRRRHTRFKCDWSSDVCSSDLSADLKVGNEVGLEFKIAEFRASLNVMGRVVRQEAPNRIAVGFVGLAPEDINAIQLYVMGRLRDMSPERDLSGIGMHRLFTP